MKFTKFDRVKSRLDLLPSDAMEIVGFVARYGGLKYEPENWRKCKNHKQFVAALLRHAYKHLKADYTDHESGLLHLAQAVCSGLFALDLFMKIGDPASMERRQFSYFAVLQRKGKKRGVILKRFKSYTAAWDYLTDQNLDPAKFPIKTVNPRDKVGTTIPL